MSLLSRVGFLAYPYKEAGRRRDCLHHKLQKTELKNAQDTRDRRALCNVGGSFSRFGTIKMATPLRGQPAEPAVTFRFGTHKYRVSTTGSKHYYFTGTFWCQEANLTPRQGLFAVAERTEIDYSM